ncbi:MAG TPA: TIGR03435 family protein [Bryobacteraceae bacterium]|nr:TIGR03435 family protein [Bryobacteraceae bacterium]
MRMAVRLVAVAFLIAVAAVAQRGQVNPSSGFSVAAIRRCDTVPGKSIGNFGRGWIRIDCFSVKSLIARAYVRFANGKAKPAIETEPIEGGPAWAETDLYTINAKADGTPTFGQMNGPLMQALLEERFRLKIHRRMIEIPVYALTVAKGGARLKAAKRACVPVDFDHPLPPGSAGEDPPPVCDSFSGSEHALEIRGATLEQFGRALSPRLKRRVLDQTGIAGHFDFRLNFSLIDRLKPNAGETREDFIFETAQSVLQPLGLKIVSTKSTSEAIVIDHLERPGDN